MDRLKVDSADPRVGKLTNREKIALEVLINSPYVINWVKSQAHFLEVDLSTVGGKAFMQRVAQHYALKLLGK